MRQTKLSNSFPEFLNHDAIILDPRCKTVIFKQNGREISEGTEKDRLWLPEILEKKKDLNVESYPFIG